MPKQQSYIEKLAKNKDTDYLQLVKNYEEELKEYANKRMPPPISLTTKNDETIKRIELFSKEIPSNKIDESNRNRYIKAFNDSLYKEEEELPTQKSIQVEDFIKILYLNNKDPDKYNMKYWSSFYEVDLNTLRNLLNFVAYPVYKKDCPNEIAEVYSFIDKDPLKKQKLIGEMNPEEYQIYVEELKKVDTGLLTDDQIRYNKTVETVEKIDNDPVVLEAQAEIKKITEDAVKLIEGTK